VKVGLMIALAATVLAPAVIERKARMDHVQDAIDAIYEALDAKDPATVSAKVAQIGAQFAIEQSLWQAAGKPDRAALALDSAARAAAIAKAATTQDWAGASAALDGLNKPCRACHDLEIPAKPG